MSVRELTPDERKKIEEWKLNTSHFQNKLTRSEIDFFLNKNISNSEWNNIEPHLKACEDCSSPNIEPALISDHIGKVIKITCNNCNCKHTIILETDLLL